MSRTIDAEVLLGIIREHGPLTKSELHKRAVGYAASQAVSLAAQDLVRKNLVTYRPGRAHGRFQIVYAAVQP